jgi:hypothetical protein
MKAVVYKGPRDVVVKNGVEGSFEKPTVLRFFTPQITAASWAMLAEICYVQNDTFTYS